MIVLQIIQDLCKNCLMAIPAVRRYRVSAGRTASAPAAVSLPRHVDALIDRVAARTSLVGKSVLEIGPGDNLVTGLAFLAAGARSYTAIDRFPGAYRDARARAWYALLAARPGYAGPAPQTFPDDPRVEIIAAPVEQVDEIGEFDVVCSLAVGEHVTSVPAFAALTARALASDGHAVHIVDFGGHHWHRTDDPNLFRRFPEWLWQAMGSNRGLPNRVPCATFEQAFNESGMTARHSEFRDNEAVFHYTRGGSFDRG